MVYINKRGVFKQGKSWSELSTAERKNPSDLTWISRYGSVTFNIVGKDLPDGGMNEAGLYIWEMGLGGCDVVYPKNPDLPKLNQMQWMQYILDGCGTIEEAVQCARDIEIDGWGWHFFVGDRNGRCAVIDFVDGSVVVHKDGEMPVPGLFNSLYSREMEWARYFKGFGGLYEPKLEDKTVPRFIKTAIMLDRFDPAQDAVTYGFSILDHLFVSEVADWSVVFDVRRRKVHFRTSRNREIKHFGIDDIDFSNDSPVMILGIDIPRGGEVGQRFEPFSAEKMAAHIRSVPVPDSFFTAGGLTKKQVIHRLAGHTDAAMEVKNQYFSGVWRSKPPKEGEKSRLTLRLTCRGDAVRGDISHVSGFVNQTPLEHIHLLNGQLIFTFRSEKEKAFMLFKGVLNGDRMKAELSGIEDPALSLELFRESDT